VTELDCRQILDAFADAVVAADSDNRIVYANPAVERLLGWAVDDLVGRPLTTLIPERLHRLHLTGFHRFVTTGLPHVIGRPIRLPALRPDGTEVEIELTLSHFRHKDGDLFLGSLRDIGDRVELERQLAVEEDLRFVMMHARCLFWHAFVEAPEPPQKSYRWQFQVFDEEAAQRFLPLDLLPGESYPEAFYRSRPLEDRRLVDRNARAALESGQSAYSHEFRCHTREGETRWLAEQTYLEPLGPGRWRAAGICTDITERKRLETGLREQAEELVESGRRKDEFLAMLAHELRNPLGAVRTALGVIQETEAGTPRYERAVDIAVRQVEQQTRMVDDLLDVSRITRGTIMLRREWLDLAQLYRRTIEDWREPLEEAGLHLSVDLPDEPARVFGDPTRLNQVLVNLLSNVLKFSNPGGHVTIHMVPEPDGRHVAVSIRDTGIGISPELLPSVFESFIQADRSLHRSRGGLGLGLALVKGLVELHDGAVTAYSEGLGRGAEFTIRLPIAECGLRIADWGTPGIENQAASEPEAGSEPDGSLAKADVGSGGGSSQSAIRIPQSAIGTPQSRRVLVVEDLRDAAEALQDLLELWGYEVRVATTGPAGVEAARSFQPDIVLCDIGLPGMDGYEVARVIRKDEGLRKDEGGRMKDESDPVHPSSFILPPFEGPQPLRLVALTGYGQEEDRRRSLAAGFDLHLTKPVDPEELKRLLAALPQPA
jgi:PAS domain S-box-containing protein